MLLLLHPIAINVLARQLKHRLAYQLLNKRTLKSVETYKYLSLLNTMHFKMPSKNL